MKIGKSLIALALLVSLPLPAVVTVRTSIEVTAEIATSVRVVYDRNSDVTEGAVQLKLEDKDGYMQGMTKAFHFIGNASKVSLELISPAGNGLTKTDDPAVIMPLGAYWRFSQNGGDSSTGFGAEATVYPTISDIPSDVSGVYIRFISARKTETYALGTYSGTYVLNVKPKS